MPDSIPQTPTRGSRIIDSLRNQTFERREGSNIRGRQTELNAESEEAVDEIEYGSKDSSSFDVVNRQIHLYGEAFVKYQEYDIKADYILFDFGKN